MSIDLRAYFSVFTKKETFYTYILVLLTDLLLFETADMSLLPAINNLDNTS